MSATASVGQSPSLEPRRAPVPAISVHGVNKSFILPHERYHTLKERALHVFRNRRSTS